MADQPLLGLATTADLLGELAARFRIDAALGSSKARDLARRIEDIEADATPEQRAYRTVDS